MDKKGFFGSGRIGFRCFAAGLLAVICMTAAAGRKEISLKEEFYGKLLAEQTAGDVREGQEQLDHVGEEEKSQESGVGDGTTNQQDVSGETAGASDPQEEEQAADAGETTDGMIRVLLMDDGYQSYWHSQVTVEGNVPLAVTGSVVETWPADSPLSLSELLKPGDQVTVAPAEEKEEARISVLSLARSQGTPAYEGSLTVTAEEEGFLLCSQVDLETYLKYVVPSEMPSGYPAEALKAQAVCARTYAVRQKEENRLKQYGADVDDSVSFQVYNNIGRQSSTDEAVDATGGVVMTYEGEPIQAYFFSTSCGHTSTDEVWGGEGAPYLRSVEVSRQSVEPDALEAWAAGPFLASEESFRNFLDLPDPDDYEREDTWYRWQITLPVRLLQQAAGKFCPQVGTVAGIKVLERSGGGAAKKLEITGDQGVCLLKDEYSIREFLSPGDVPITCGDGTLSTAMSILPSAYFVCEPVYQEEALKAVTLRGGGYGHGVGMSQNGARHLADDGKNWKEILNVFYREITLEQPDA
ncbi:MAG TPA: SpoIID/LytB domain-containing protein [Candidatus Pullilachnospira intestinigallinarum]|nr:SpoIID/LytB domain-containing protein [Candidatus Pullilachnospira intestinigallinarum]